MSAMLPAHMRPYLVETQARLGSLGEDVPGMSQARTALAALLEGVEPRERAVRVYGELFAGLRRVNRELRAGATSPIPLPLPASWGRQDNYLLFREDFGLPPLLRGARYTIAFESPFPAEAPALLGARTAYLLACSEVVDRRRVEIRCRQALRKAWGAVWAGERSTLMSLSFIAPAPSGDNFEYPITTRAGKGKIVLARIEGE